MSKPFYIREAVASESSLIASFQLKMALETENLMLNPIVLQNGVNAVFDDPAKGYYYVAQAGDEVIGCMLTTYEWSDWRNGAFVWLQSLWVEPKWRGKGVFKALYNHVKESVLRNENLKGMRLYVFHTNKQAQKVYGALEMGDESYRMFEWVK
ncbi:MAG: GNAT family N-acetyltransferase [Bacteroidales bacterium]|nr:GNAT family N-acetyltransferase [Bacteroidales bacterium]MDZ4203881.1 GNAT family N-acetyltransferase [Bacteroidales bacterium]